MNEENEKSDFVASILLNCRIKNVIHQQHILYDGVR